MRQLLCSPKLQWQVVLWLYTTSSYGCSRIVCKIPRYENKIIKMVDLCRCDVYIVADDGTVYSEDGRWTEQKLDDL